MDIDECTLRHLHIPQQKETIYIGGRRPPEGWIKLNSDGACKENNDILGCGGLFRNSDGRWIKGYAKKIGPCDAFHAEMWGLYLSLDMAWRDHISYFIIENDLKLLIDMITGNCTIGGATPILVRCIHNLSMSSFDCSTVESSLVNSVVCFLMIYLELACLKMLQ
jgi:hypothetical protein